MSEMEWLRIFAGNLDYWLTSTGMSQHDLAKVTGLDQSAISRYANAQRMPTIRAIVNIANALGCSMDDLIDFGDTIHQ